MRSLSQLLTVMICICSSGICWAQQSDMEELYREIDRRRTMPIYYRNIYKISDNAFSWYPVGFIYLNDYALFKDEDHHVFLLTDYKADTKISSNNILERHDLNLLLMGYYVDSWVFSYMTYSEFYQFEKLIPNNFTDSLPGEKEQILGRSEDLVQFEYSPAPDGFLSVLMTGTAYNHIIYKGMIDGWIPPIKFPDENAYYRVLIPYWQKAKTDTTYGAIENE